MPHLEALRYIEMSVFALAITREPGALGRHYRAASLVMRVGCCGLRTDYSVTPWTELVGEVRFPFASSVAVDLSTHQEGAGPTTPIC